MIIDTHIHIGGKAGTFDMKESDVLYAIQTYHIDKAIVSNADSLEFDANHVILPEKLQVSQYNSNVRMINFARNNSSRLYAAAWIKPNTERLDKQFSELLKRNLDIVKAIKVHPFYSALAFNNEKMYEYIELARKLNLPMITHTANDKFSNPELVFEMAKKYPDVRFIMAHLELDSDNKRATELCAQLPNLYADTAWVSLDSATLYSYINALKKIFVIEDSPAWNPNLRSKAAIRTTETRYFVDPSIAAAALSIGPNDLINDLHTMGLLFENLCVRDLRIYADLLDGEIYHFRDKSGLECDVVLHLRNGSYGLIEIKLGGDTLIDSGAESLLSLAKKIDTSRMKAPSFLMVLCAKAPFAYRRRDGVIVTPISCIRP